MKPSQRLDGVDVSIIRQINALGTSLSINLGIGEPNLEPDETFREMAREAASHGSWRYTPNPGNASLRTLIAESLDGHYDPRSEICVTAGTQEALYAIAQAWFDAGDEVLVPDPGFVSYEVIARLAGATPVRYELEPDAWQPDPKAIERLFTKRTKAIIVNSPSNPTGSTIPADRLREIAGMARKRQALVITDEVYREIHYEERPASMAGTDDNVILVSGLSKSHGITGLRLGWVAAREGILAPVVRAHQYIATCASSFSQQLGEGIFKNTEWNSRWLAGMREQFRQQCDTAINAVRLHMEVDVKAPGGAFYLFVPVPVCNTLPFARSLATDASVLAIPGVAFGRQGEGFLRISFAAPTEQIQAGIRRIGQYLRDEELRIENAECRT